MYGSSPDEQPACQTRRRGERPPGLRLTGEIGQNLLGDELKMVRLPKKVRFVGRDAVNECRCFVVAAAEAVDKAVILREGRKVVEPQALLQARLDKLALAVVQSNSGQLVNQRPEAVAIPCPSASVLP